MKKIRVVTNDSVIKRKIYQGVGDLTYNIEDGHLTIISRTYDPRIDITSISYPKCKEEIHEVFPPGAWNSMKRWWIQE